jgi:hypothetical protein
MEGTLTASSRSACFSLKTQIAMIRRIYLQIWVTFMRKNILLCL